MYYLMNLLDEINEMFGTEVKTEDDLVEIFDTYECQSDFEFNCSCSYEACFEAGTAGVLSNGEYIFFNECNYDWKTGKSTLFNEKGN